MRTLSVILAVSAVLIGGGACSSDSDPAASPTTLDSAATVCAEAKAEGARAASDYTDILLGGLESLDDPAKSAEYRERLQARMAQWETKLTEWSARQVSPELKAALVDAAATVKRLNDPGDYTGLKDTQAEFTRINAAITTACGS